MKPRFKDIRSGSAIVKILLEGQTGGSNENVGRLIRLTQFNQKMVECYSGCQESESDNYR